jgi:CO dehydrogenase/acetyl-CoA synthase epsilon subunit
MNCWGLQFQFDSMGQARRAFELTLAYVQNQSGEKNVAVALVTVKKKRPCVIVGSRAVPSAELISEVVKLCRQGRSVDLSPENLIATIVQHELEGRSRGGGKYRRFQPRVSNN